MDAKTQQILEKTRQRRLQLDLELKATPVLQGDLPSATCSLSSVAADSTSPMSFGFSCEALNVKKRKSIDHNDDQDENVCAASEMPSKKPSSNDLMEDDKDVGSISSNPRNSVYPFDELETLRKQIDFSLMSPSPVSSVTSKIDSCKIEWGSLAAKVDDFEVDTRSHRSVLAPRRREESPSRWGSYVPAIEIRSSAVNRNQNPHFTNSLVESSGRTMDSGIETFYRPKSVEIIDEAEEVAKSAITLPSPKPPGISSAAMTSQLRGRETASSKVASITNKTTSIVDSRLKTFSSPASGKIGSVTKKAPTASVLDGRPKTGFNTPATNKIGSAAKKTPAASGVDNRPRMDMSKLRKRWEKASQSGVPLNPDESLTDQDSILSAAAQMAQPRRFVKETTPPQSPSMVKDVEKVENATTTTKAKDEPPLRASTPTEVVPPIISKPQSPPLIDAHEVVPSAIENQDFTDDISINSSALSDYLDEAISCAQAAAKTPQKPAFAVPATKLSPRPVSLVHTVSMYRRMEQTNRATSRPQSVVVKPPLPPATPRVEDSSSRRVAKYEQVQTLDRMIQVEQEHILQASRALNLCRSTDKFRSSNEEVIAEKTLLLATEARRCLLEERNRLDSCYVNRVPFNPIPPLGTLTVNSIRLQLQRNFFNYEPGEISYFICLLKHRDIMHVTQMVDSEEVKRHGQLTFNNYIQFHNLAPDFEISLEVYALVIHREPLSPNAKTRTIAGKLLTLGRQNTRPGLLTSAPTTSLGGPGAVMETSFRLAGRLTITLSSVARRNFKLQEVNYSLPLEGGIYLELRCVCDEVCADEERGFLNQYTQIGGSAAWDRNWMVLSDGRLQFWKYPEEEIDKKPPLNIFDLMDCVSDGIGPASRQITTRPNTFAFQTRDSSWYIFAADTMDDVTRWTSKLNQTLKNLRTWSITA